MTKQVFLYSHGFGVQKDDRGLFTEIAEAFPNAEHVMFDYNQIGQAKNILTISPFSIQKRIFEEKLSWVKQLYPRSETTLICHSQGSVIAALARPSGISRAILLAPPAELDNEKSLNRFGSREGAHIDIKGVSSFPRRDGSTTLVPSKYWEERIGLDPLMLYKNLAQITPVTVVKATRDEVLLDTDYSSLDGFVVNINIDADHDFSAEGRKRLIDFLCKQLC